MDVFTAIDTQKENKDCTGKPISYRKLALLCRAGCRAPTAGGLPHTNFVLVNDGRTINQIAETTTGQDWIRKAGGIIAVICQKKLLQDWYGERAVERAEEDAALATQNILLAATGLHLATQRIHEYNKDKVRELLSPPEKIKFDTESTQIYSLIAVGEPLTQDQDKRPLELQNRIFFEIMGERSQHPEYLRAEYAKLLEKVGYNITKTARSSLTKMKKQIKEFMSNAK